MLKLDHTILACALYQSLTCVPFLAGTFTLTPETTKETFVEISDTEPEDPVGASPMTYPGKGETYITLYSFQPTFLAVA